MSTYVVLLRDTTTGEIRPSSRSYACKSFDYAERYWWTKGNMGCDCNRGMLFDAETDAWDWPCNTDANRFELLAVVPPGYLPKQKGAA